MTTPYRRLVFDLGGGTPDADTLRAVAALATALGVDLQCVFIEDEAVLALAELPFAREYRLPTGDWTPIDATTIATELRRAATQTQRLVSQTLEAAGDGQAFALLRGDPATGACEPPRCGTSLSTDQQVGEGKTMRHACRAFQVEIKSSGRKWKSVRTEIRPATPGLLAPTSSPRESPDARSSARAAASRSFSSAKEAGSGTSASILVTWAGLVPQLTWGSSVVASMVTILSKTASSSVTRLRQ